MSLKLLTLNEAHAFVKRAERPVVVQFPICVLSLKVLAFVKGVLWTTHGSLSGFLLASSY